ncbi:hypothetical protein D4764_11G0009920 [Takifugu flavidus]|uniref:Uncharacterized protein n=1 Tax=Takifugu flavidus TaxID=433684 RepID=A0A5C6PIZ1_9TELE|nr:hypothetical protein D4764_11G0009920 [Takifugu flavidus]
MTLARQHGNNGAEWESGRKERLWNGGIGGIRRRRAWYYLHYRGAKETLQKTEGPTGVFTHTQGLVECCKTFQE